METMRITCILIMATLFFTILSWSQSSADSAIRERVKQFETAYNAGDADAVASIYAVDGTHTYALGMTDRGRVEIAKGLRVQFAGPMKGTQIAITPLHIRSLSSEIAVEEASFTLTGLKDAAGKDIPVVKGLCLGIYQKASEQWYAVAIQCMVPPPMPENK